jgi:hypothetical protein
MEKPTLSDDHQPKLASESRRRFGKAGLAASGVILTLASKSALGCQNVSPSGFVSGNVSGHLTEGTAGYSPGYWKNHSHWPINIDTEFGQIFGPLSIHSPYKNVSFLTLLTPQHYDDNKLGMHLVAAYLNAEAGMTPYLTTQTIVQIFTEWQAQGYYVPTGNVHWNAGQIVTYLESTQQ